MVYNATIMASVRSVDIITVHDDYIEVVWDGPQNADKVRASNTATFEAAEKLRAQHKPVRVLLTVKNHPKVPDMGGFREVLKIFQVVEFERLALCGTIPPKFMALVTVVISSFNKELEIKYFSDQLEALTWLKTGRVK